MKPTSIIIHHTDSPRDKTTIEDINSWHKVRDFTLSSLGYYIGYHYVILWDGTIIQTREEDEEGCHCVPNDGKLGICLTGNFEVEYPSERQLNSLQRLLESLKLEYKLQDSDIFGHYEKNRVACPGKNLINWINLYRKLSFLQRLLQQLLKVVNRV